MFKLNTNIATKTGTYRVMLVRQHNIETYVVLRYDTANSYWSKVTSRMSEQHALTALARIVQAN